MKTDEEKETERQLKALDNLYDELEAEVNGNILNKIRQVVELEIELERKSNM